MRNLKKVLTLVLTLAMLLSVMVVGAGAAFSDQDSIKNTEAVNTCNALNIINGENGSFYPTRNVTRAEMCKMICVALNGGREPALATGIGSTFTDTVGHWASPYIEYCVREGVVGGIGGGLFDPNGAVTGTQAAKMLLVAMGYNASRQGYVGSDAWELNINGDAAKNGLYDGLETIDASAALNRDNAAQIIYNALEATMVEYVYSAQTVDGTLTMVPTLKDKTYFDDGTEIKETILHAKYGMVKAEGVILNKVEPGVGSEKGTFRLYVNTPALASTVKGTADFTKVGTDYTNLLGQKVDVLYKNNTEKTVYGVYASDENTVVTTNQSAIELDGSKIKFNDKSYELDSTFKIVDGAVVPGAVAASGFVSATSYDKITFVDNDGDDKYEVAVVTTVTPAKVTYVSSDEIIAGGETYKYADENIASGLAKGDYVTVVYNVATDKKDIVKINATDGTVSGTKSGEYLIDGTWYKDGSTTPMASASVAAGDDVTAYIVNGVIYAGEKSSATSLSDVVMLIQVESGNLSNKARFMHTDGSVQTGEIDTSDGAPAAPADTDAGKLYTVKSATNGYRFTPVGADIGDYTWEGTSEAVAISAGAATIGGTTVADDAVIMAVSTTNHGYKMYTGKQLKKMVKGSEASISDFKSTAISDSNKGEVFGTAFGSFTSKVNGLTRVSVASILVRGDMPKGGIDAKNYGLVVSDPYSSKDSITYDVWTGSETITSVIDEDSTVNDTGTPGVASKVMKGDVIKYSSIDNKTIKDVTTVPVASTLTTDSLTKAFVQGTDTDVKNLWLNGDDDAANKFEITKDSVIMYYNSKDMKGVADGEIQLADDEEGIYIQNVKAVVDTGSSEILFLLVDVKNKLDDATTHALTWSSTATNATISVKVGDDTISTGATLAAGTVATVEITGNGGAANVDVIVSGGKIVDNNNLLTKTVAAAENTTVKFNVVVGAGATSITFADHTP